MVQPDHIQNGHTAGLPSQADAPAARLDHVPNVPESTCPQKPLDLSNETLSPSNINGMIKAIADTAATTKALVEKQSPKTCNQLELPIFSGNPMQWLSFKKVFESNKPFFSPLENVTRLQRALRGPAREAVASQLLLADTPDGIMQQLEYQFARPEVIVFHEIAALKKLPSLTPDLKGLSAFTSVVRNSVATIRLLNQIEYLYSPELFYCVIGKLNHTLRMRWTDFAFDHYEQKPKLELLSDFLVRELERHIKFGMSPESIQLTSKLPPFKPAPRNEIATHALNSTKPKTNCIYCEQAHNIKDCTNFVGLSPEERWCWIRSKKICYRCLKPNLHTWNDCKVKPCGINGCTRRHHALLHKDAMTAQPVVSYPCIEEVVGLSADQPHSSEQLHASTTLLKVVPVTISGPAGYLHTFALLDDGSTATLIDTQTANKIGATGPSDNIKIKAVGGMSIQANVSYISFNIKGKYTSEVFTIKNARTVDSLSLLKQTIEKSDISKYQHLSDLADMLTYTNAVPTILIGAENWHLSITREVRKGSRTQPVACLTALGWTLYGSLGDRAKPTAFVNYSRSSEGVTSDVPLENLIKEHYKLESIGISKQTPFSKEDQRAIDILNNSAERLPSGRFSVGLPWRQDITAVPDSYFQAESRFKSLERRMAKDSTFAVSYQNYVTDVLQKGYAEECSVDTYHTKQTPAFCEYFGNVALRWYLPHFGVYHPQKKKLRVVHDAAAKTNGVSLNSLLLPGPDLLQSLIGILYRFREGRYAITADVKEMFPQIKIRDKDRDALRFLWRADPKDTIKEYRMTSVIFGACSSPFIALYIKNKNAEELAHKYPAAADAVINDHYMDDYIGSHDDIDEAAQLASDIVTVHKAACFEMRGWIANNDHVLAMVPPELRAAVPSEVVLGNHNDQTPRSNIVRALGVIWNPKEDFLGFRTGLTELSFKTTLPPTKREALSQLMRIYDPLGLLAPIIIKGRIMFQRVWRSNIGWDDKLSYTEAEAWKDWLTEVRLLTSINVPRCYFNGKILNRELHLFADARKLVYACVAYWRFTLPDGLYKLALIGSKARVTPLKPVSKLQAALIASRLATTIIENHRSKPVRVVYWSDSRTVLSWIRSDARIFRPFVAHRVGKITEKSNVGDWRWVPSEHNAADDATRVHHLEPSSRWFTGPSFLLESENMGPVEPLNLVAPLLTEMKSVNACEVVGFTNPCGHSWPEPITPNFERFSTWIRLLRATARVFQAVEFFKRLCNFNFRQSHQLRRTATSFRPSDTACTNLTPLAADHLKAAERQILLRTQIDSFKEEIHCLLHSQLIPKKSRLLKLSPSLGEDRLLRLAGRISTVIDVHPDVRRPILLDGNHAVVKLLVDYYHRRIAAHGNNELVINELRQKYWIIHLRPTVRNVASKCSLCRFKRTQPAIPVTGDLPPERMAHHQRPFTFTGVDYFGPINVTIGRRHEKRYVALYTCLTTRAVHLEVAHSLSADSAIMSLRRFIARRGVPSTIFSDNGTAFVGANRLLKEFYQTSVQDSAANTGITWRFIPPAAPTFGGCWERMVRSIKTALTATLKERAPKEEVFYTLLLEAEAVVNSRPLTHVSVDPDDNETLTPFHFLIGTSSPQILPTTLTNSDLCSRADYRKALRLADHFWNRWVREILPTLQPRQPGNLPKKLEVGDLVLVVDETLPRGTWPRGRIITTYPGKDGVVRVVDVGTAGGVLRRPSRKIISLLQ